MKIAVSACLLGENCKYNGGNNYSEKVSQFVEGHELILVCPEVLGGLPTPRESAEIVNGIVSHKDGTSVDAEFRRGAEMALNIVKDNQVDMVVLQSRSPSWCESNLRWLIYRKTHTWARPICSVVAEEWNQGY
jgi:uncharacterized protein YbbK (DUF523 family)